MNELADAGIKTRIGSASGPTWHAEPVQGIYATLETGRRGLSTEEAARRLKLHGPNELPPPPGRNPILRFLAQFNNPLIYFLLAAAVAALDATARIRQSLSRWFPTLV